MKPALKPGDRIAAKFTGESVMGYFLGYYNDDYVNCTLDGNEFVLAAVYTVERRRVSKAPADPPPVANIQVLEATTPPLPTNKEAYE